MLDINIIENSHSLMLENLHFDGSQTLELTLQQLVRGKEVEMTVGAKTTKAWDLEPTSSLKLVFSQVVAFQTYDEMYGTMHTEKIFKGKYLRLFEKSQYLEFIVNYTSAAAYFEGDKNLLHYQVVCENQIVDVLTVTTPNLFQ